MAVDEKAFIKALDEGKFLKSYQGIGVYWSWDKDKAECHWGFHDGHGDEISILAWIDTKNIDYEATVVLNLAPPSGPEEAEVRVKEGSNVKVIEVWDSKGKVIWSGENIIKAKVENKILIAALNKILD